MNRTLISAVVALIAITASANSFARGNDIEGDYTAAQASSISSSVSREAVRAQAQAARAFTHLNGDLYGSVTQGNDAMALTRDHVRMQAKEFSRTHKRDMNDLG
jgi:hypothetical protein